jgi:hypothetical protein
MKRINSPSIRTKNQVLDGENVQKKARNKIKKKQIKKIEKLQGIL